MSKVLKTIPCARSCRARFEGVDGGLVVSTSGPWTATKTYALPRGRSCTSASCKLHGRERVRWRSGALRAYRLRRGPSSNVFNGPVGVVYAPRRTARPSDRGQGAGHPSGSARTRTAVGRRSRAASAEGGVMGPKRRSALKDVPSKPRGARASSCGVLQAPVHARLLATIRRAATLAWSTWAQRLTRQAGRGRRQSTLVPGLSGQKSNHFNRTVHGSGKAIFPLWRIARRARERQSRRNHGVAESRAGLTA